MSRRPECPRCRRPVIRALSLSGSRRDVSFELQPSPAGRWLLSFDTAPATAQLLPAPRPGRPTLYEKHFDVCPSLRRGALGDEPPPPPPALVAQRDALAVALSRLTHEFRPGHREDGTPTDLCDENAPYRCGRVVDDPVHSTPPVVIAGLTSRSHA